MKENYTEREKELKQRLAERDQKLRKFRIGFFTVSSLLSGLCLGRCAPAVNLDYPTATAATICSGTSLLGTAGTALCAVTGTSTVVSLLSLLQSNAYRDLATTQISQSAEVTTYAGLAFPAGYRDIPVRATDDDGYTGGSVTYATRPGADCGTSGTIADRVSNCATTIGANATWDGAVKGNAGQGVWKLVTRSGANNEVWQDQRTGLLWSSLVAASGTTNWCQAAGNAEAADTDNYCNNVAYQPNYVSNNNIARSHCAETGTIPAVASEAVGSLLGNAWSGTYSAKKGGMGLQSTTVVRWRLPTIYDYKQADIDGIRFVMPDMGASGTLEWSASLYSNSRASAWHILGSHGYMNGGSRTNLSGVRCTGR